MEPTKSTTNGLQRLLKKKRWTQELLAESTGLSRAHISKLCSGSSSNPSKKTIRILAETFLATEKKVQGWFGATRRKYPPSKYRHILLPKCSPEDGCEECGVEILHMYGKSKVLGIEKGGEVHWRHRCLDRTQPIQKEAV